MTTYKELKGTNIEAVATDPTYPVTGQVWYNTTSNVLKGSVFAAAAWASGGSLNTGRSQMGASGVQNAAIASGGHSIYELARLGVPTIHFLVNKNQRVAEKWKETGFTYFVGWYDKKNFMQKISKALLKIQSIKKRKLMSKSGQNLIKTNGANLIVAKLAKLI